MAPKILLVNYSKSDADIVARETGLKVIRGYLSEIDTYTAERDGNVPNIKFYSPEAYYECSMVFINLPRTEKLKVEFDSVAYELSRDDMMNMLAYWKSNILVFFVGDTNISSLSKFGIPLRLTASSGNDTVTHLRIKEEHPLYELFQTISAQIKLPTARYVINGLKVDQYETLEQAFYSFGSNWNRYIVNANGDVLACALSSSNSDYAAEEPAALIIPSPKKLSTTTSKVVDSLGEYYKLYTPGTEWQTSDSLLPQKQMRKLQDEITAIKLDALAQLKVLEEQIDTYRTDYSFLGDLVSKQGDELVDAVYKVLVDVLKLKVSKSDALKPKEPVEDLLVEIGERKILVEVKGTASVNPPLDYPQQAFTHITRRGYNGSVEAALVLNHDMKKDPSYRKPAYSDKEKARLIANLYFVDTRTLLAITIAVLDGELSASDAQEILFGSLGRIVFTPESSTVATP